MNITVSLTRKWDGNDLIKWSHQAVNMMYLPRMVPQTKNSPPSTWILQNIMTVCPKKCNKSEQITSNTPRQSFPTDCSGLRDSKKHRTKFPRKHGRIQPKIEQLTAMAVSQRAGGIPPSGARISSDRAKGLHHLVGVREANYTGGRWRTAGDAKNRPKFCWWRLL